MWNKLLMTVHACALEWMPLLSAEGHTRGASQCFPHYFSSQEVCKHGKAYNRMFSVKLTALPDSEEGLLTQQIRGSYQHTGLSGRCFLKIILTHTHRVSTVNSVSQCGHILTLSQHEHKKEATSIIFCRLPHPIKTIPHARKIITVPRGKRKEINKEKNAQLHKLPY